MAQAGRREIDTARREKGYTPACHVLLTSPDERKQNCMRAHRFFRRSSHTRRVVELFRVKETLPSIALRCASVYRL